MFRHQGFAAAVAATAGLLMLAACTEDDDTGRITLAVTDAPVDGATSVVVEFTGVELKRSGGTETFEFDEPRSIDLLALTGDESLDLLEGQIVPAGSYQWISLKVNAERSSTDSFIELDDGSMHSLWIPSGAQSGLRLVQGFTVAVGGTSDFTVDFDLRKSVHDPEGSFPDYVLRPALRLVDNLEVGTIVGTVDPSLVTEGCEAAVYAFTGSGVTPDDEDPDDAQTDPITSTQIELDDATGIFGFEIGFLEAGDYTLAFTCEADMDDPAADDEITFSATDDATVSAGEITEVGLGS